MKTVKIKIKDNLSPEREVLEIAKQLAKNPLMLGNGVKALIGQNVEIQHLKTTIEIERIPTEPTMHVCSVCECNFDKKVGKSISHNYGGKPRKIYVCSEDCIDVVSAYLPKNRLVRKPSFLY